MPVNFNDFIEGVAPSDTDHVVGFVENATGGERKWTVGNLRASIITGAATSIDQENLTQSKALVSTSQGKVGVSTVTSTELSYLQGTTSNIQQQIASAIPAGAVMAFAMKTVPDGWLMCNGEEVSKTLYARLWSAIENTYGVSSDVNKFKLPDLRGYFVRGWGVAGENGANSDGTVSSTFGVKQADEFKAHTHTQSPNIANPGPAGGGFIAGYGNSGTTQTGSTGGAETRPKNIAMLYCIKF